MSNGPGKSVDRCLASAPPRLVHVVTVTFSYFFFRGQAGYMARRGFDVHVVSSAGEEQKPFAEREGVETHAVPMERKISPARDAVAIFQLWRLFRRLRPTIVHTHTPKGGLLGTIASRMARVPVCIYHVHGFPFLTATGSRRRLLMLTERISCRLATQVLCVSHSVREVAIAEKIVPEAKIKVLLGGSINGVDAKERFNPDRVRAESRRATRAAYGVPDDALVLGYIGRLVRDKGIVELMEAWDSLREELPGLHLLVVGPIEARDAVPEHIARTLAEDERIHMVGLDWETPPLFAAMDVLCLPSYREGFPVTLLEAAAMALPIVATRVPGCVDAVLDGQTGTLVPPGDAVALAEAIRGYLNEPDLRHEHGTAARRRVAAEFDQHDVWRAMFREYARLLCREGLTPPADASDGDPVGSHSLPAQTELASVTRADG